MAKRNCCGALGMFRCLADQNIIKNEEILHNGGGLDTNNYAEAKILLSGANLG